MFLFSKANLKAAKVQGIPELLEQHPMLKSAQQLGQIAILEGLAQLTNTLPFGPSTVPLEVAEEVEVVSQIFLMVAELADVASLELEQSQLEQVMEARQLLEPLVAQDQFAPIRLDTAAVAAGQRSMLLVELAALDTSAAAEVAAVASGEQLETTQLALAEQAAMATSSSYRSRRLNAYISCD